MLRNFKQDTSERVNSNVDIEWYFELTDEIGYVRRIYIYM